MHMVGLKTLKNKLSEYVRLAASGETVVITDRNRVVAEIVPPRRDTNAFFERGVREGWLSPPRNPSAEPRPCPGPRPHAQRRYAIVDRATEAGGVDTAGLGSRNSPFLFPFAPSTRFISRPSTSSAGKVRPWSSPAMTASCLWRRAPSGSHFCSCEAPPRYAASADRRPFGRRMGTARKSTRAPAR